MTAMTTKSKFFTGSSSESDNASDSEKDSSDDNQVAQRQVAGRFANFDESDSGTVLKLLTFSIVNRTNYTIRFGG